MSDFARSAVVTPDAPAPSWSYSQGIRHGGFLQVSGQIAADPATGELVCLGDVAGQTERVLANVEAVLRAGGATFADVISMRVYVTDIAHVPAMNDVYGRYLKARVDVLPARTTLVSGLPREGLLVEIDALAILPG